MTSSPSSAWRLTTSLVAVATRSHNPGGFLSVLLLYSSIRSARSGGRGRLPVCVVRMRMRPTLPRVCVRARVAHPSAARATRDVNDLARHEAGFVANQKADHVGHVLRHP